MDTRPFLVAFPAVGDPREETRLNQMSSDGNGESTPPPSVSQSSTTTPQRHDNTPSRQNGTPPVLNGHDLRRQQHQQTPPPSMAAAATAGAVAIRLGRGHNLFNMARNNQGTGNHSTSNGHHVGGVGGGGNIHKKAAHGRHVTTRGGIYAATTTVQQDIVRLERDLEKILLRPHARSRRISSSNARLSMHDTQRPQNGITDDTTATQGNSKRNLFMRYSRMDLSMATGDDDGRATAGEHGSRISAIMTSIMDTLEKHKVATQLPFTSDILGVLSVPFSQTPLSTDDCNQALDIFDYIRERFKQVDAIDNLEQITFCCRLLKCGHLKLKMRLVDTMKLMLASSMGNPAYLPSSPTAFHALVYTLADALSYASAATTDRPQSRHPEEYDYVRSALIDYLDKLSSGNMIPLMGKDWDRYFIPADSNSDPPAPLSVARFCVLEALCRSLMVSSDTSHSGGVFATALAKRTYIVQDLLPRYWEEPDVPMRRSYATVLFVLSEAATDWFLNATPDDLRQTTSPVSLLKAFIEDKITVTTLQMYLPNWHDDPNVRAVYTNVISMILSLLSITSLHDPHHLHSNSPRSTPSHSPRPSAYDIPSPDGSAMWSPDELSTEHLSLYSNTDRSSEKPTSWRHTIALIRSYFEAFWSSSTLQTLVMEVVAATVEDASWDKLVRIYENLAFNMDETIGDKVVTATLPRLLSRLANTLPSPTTPGLSNLMSRISQSYRPVFYRHVITCAASNDEQKVSTQLVLMSCLRKYMSSVQYWMHDAEMINVLLLSDLGAKKDTASNGEEVVIGDGIRWGNTTLGQCVVATEFLWAIKELRDKQSSGTLANMEESEIAKKFLIDLERRIAVFMTAKEKMTLIPLPLRVILCNIFLEIRFFCNTTHRPGWLLRAIDWAIQQRVTSTSSDPFDITNSPMSEKKSHVSVTIHPNHIENVMLMFQRIRIVYAMTVDELETESVDPVEYFDRPIRQPSDQSLLDTPVTSLHEQDPVQLPDQTRRRECISSIYPITQAAAASKDVRPPTSTHDANKSLQLASTLAKRRLDEMSSINQDPFGAVFSLLVAVYTSLTTQEFATLVNPLWQGFIDDRNPQSFVPAAFLLMQCSEKIPKQTIEVFMHDFYSGDPFRRLAAIEKQASMSGYRFNILAQEYIPVSNRKRPFRGDGGAFSTPFVPTDLGSNRFTMDEPRWMAKLKHASNFPIELKRQIQELGWDDDDQGEEHEALKKVLTPLALLPSLFLEDEDEPSNDGGAPDNTTGNAGAAGGGAGGGGTRNEGETTRHVNVSKIIARRKRAATVHAMTVANLSLVDLLGDDFSGVANGLRDLLETYLRDDPALFLRPFLGELGKTQMARHRELLTRLRYLTDLRAKLPPGFTYILFNYLAGMLKWLTRENKEEGLVLMMLIHPLLVELAMSTNELSIRDLRKNKIEHLLASTGRFWFINEQPASMFPRRITQQGTPFAFLDIPWEVFSVAILRTSHIQFLTNFLARYPREVYAIKKTLQEYEPIPMPNKKSNERLSGTAQYFPDITLRKRQDTSFVFEEEDVSPSNDEIKAIPRHTQEEEDTGLLSSLRARVWLQFIDALLNGLNKNYNDRNELERILKGVNMIIMEHHSDYGIIGQALILYTRVVTRFKRLFVNNRGHGTFLHALFKVFCEVERFPHVRSAITFAWCRFYAVHEESFVFQMLGTLVPIILDAYDKSTSLGAWMADNLYYLMQAMHNPPRLGATSDVLGLQLQVELDDHERSVQERIDAVSNPMAMPLSATILKPLSKSATAPIVPLAVSDYDNRPFPMQDFVKLFLTIIAYDPGSLRAEQFVKMFRHMLPRFCKLGNLGTLVNDGIVALIDVFLKFSKNAKPAAAAGGDGQGGATSGSSAPHINFNVSNLFSSEENAGPTQGESSTQHAYGKQWQQNDRLTIKREFVGLVEQFFKCGGALNETNHEKMSQIIRIIMRDYASVRGAICKTGWIRNYLVYAMETMVDMRNYTKPLKTMLTAIHGQLRTQWKTVDATELYEGLATMMENGQGKALNMHDVAGLLRERFVSFGLMIATRAPGDWNELGLEIRTRFRKALVRLIVAILEHSSQDVLQEIEQLPPSISLIGSIVVPICLKYDTRYDSGASVPSLMRPRFRPSDPTATWMRLLAYVSKSCSQASLFKSKSTGFSLTALASNMGGGGQQQHSYSHNQNEEMDDGDVMPEPRDGKSTPTSVAHLFSLSIVAMKIILIRGSKSFDKIRGAWVQVAYFIKGALIFGQTLKTLKQRPTSGRSTPRGSHAPQPSPGLSPPNNPHSLWPGTPTTPESAPATAGIGATTNSSTSSAPPVSVLYDYATWCFLEYVVCYKAPLSLLLRDFVQDKLRDMGSTARPTSGRSPSFATTPTVGNRQSRKWKSWANTDSQPPQQQQQAMANTYASDPLVPPPHHQQVETLAPPPPSPQQQADTSAASGLGLHIPNSRSSGTGVPQQQQPMSSSQSIFIDEAPPLSPTAQPIHSRRGSRANNTNTNSMPVGVGSTELHIIHAETINALMNIQSCLGFNTALPWGTDTTSPQHARPWTYRMAVSKATYEWQMILQLYTQLFENPSTTNTSPAPLNP